MSIELAVGIDPGLNGGFAFLNSKHELLMLYKMPTIETRKQKKHAKSGKMVSTVNRDVNVSEVVQILQPLTAMGSVHIFLEKVQSRPANQVNAQTGERKATQGIASTFKFGVGYGMLLGVVAGLRLPYTEMVPQTWMKWVGMRKGKDGARARAAALFPAWGKDFVPANSDGLADASLIALAGLYSLQKAAR